MTSEGGSATNEKLSESENSEMMKRTPIEKGIESKTNSRCWQKFSEIAIRIVFFIIFIRLETMQAFKRVIHSEELWLYKNPPTSDYVPALYFLPASFLVPFAVNCIYLLIQRDRRDFGRANNALTLGLLLAAVTTSLLKITTGRPRPDFFFRCFPDGNMSPEMVCTGDPNVVNEGRKSFPSGHSSLAFAGFGFIFFYVSAKLNTFDGSGRGNAWRLCLPLFPLFAALLVAVSRTCDYHHHWQDVTVGSLLGFGIMYICYRQYFPSIFGIPQQRIYSPRSIPSKMCYSSITAENGERNLLVDSEKDSKLT